MCDKHDCEQQSGTEWRASYISGNTFARKLVKFAIVDEWAIFEGDIVLGRADAILAATESDSTNKFDIRSSKALKGIGISGVGFRWPGGVIPFQIDPTLPSPARVTGAIAHWQQNTVIRFVPRTTEANFVTFRPSATVCNSRVGMVGGEQFINLAATCSQGNVIHEIGHAVGLWHEQSREDRNNFVTIDFTNIIAANW